MLIHSMRNRIFGAVAEKTTPMPYLAKYQKLIPNIPLDQ